MAKEGTQETNVKVKAQRVDITTLIVESAYAKVFSTGSRGFFGKALDTCTGKHYQITAVEIGSKNGGK